MVLVSAYCEFPNHIVYVVLIKLNLLMSNDSSSMRKKGK